MSRSPDKLLKAGLIVVLPDSSVHLTLEGWKIKPTTLRPETINRVKAILTENHDLMLFGDSTVRKNGKEAPFLRRRTLEQCFEQGLVVINPEGFLRLTKRAQKQVSVTVKVFSGDVERLNAFVLSLNDDRDRPDQ